MTKNGLATLRSVFKVGSPIEYAYEFDSCKDFVLAPQILRSSSSSRQRRKKHPARTTQFNDIKLIMMFTVSPLCPKRGGGGLRMRSWYVDAQVQRG